MMIELEERERQFLINLVESRLGELGPEIRRSTMSVDFHNSLKEEHSFLERLLAHLRDGKSAGVKVS